MSLDISYKSLSDRIIKVAKYFLDNNLTIREVADKFDISKSSIHLDLTTRLKNIDSDLFKEVKKQLDYNKSIRHIRGGAATKKYWENRLKN